MMHAWSTRLTLAAVGAILALATASTVAVAAGTGAFSAGTTAGRTSATCSVPALPGTTVDVSLLDMGAMMGRPGRPPQTAWPQFTRGMMRLTASPATVQHGTVSLVATNNGYLTHELVVLPLPPGQPAGSRTPEADGTVDETGSLGEASAACAAGTGTGIPPRSTSWTTLTLPAGRYELVCNLPGHYLAGMTTELDVY